MQFLLNVLYIYLIGFLITSIINMIMVVRAREEIFHWSFFGVCKQLWFVGLMLIASVQVATMWFFLVPMFCVKKALEWRLKRRIHEQE